MIAKRPMLILCFLLLPLLLGAGAQPSPAELPLARRACYLKALPGWNEGSNHAVIQANAAYADCLEGLVLSTLQAHYPANIQGQDPKSFLAVLLSQLDTLAYLVETEPRVCGPDCGTMWQTVASGRRGKFLEELLQRLAERLLAESDASDLAEDPSWQACWQEPQRCELSVPLLSP